MPIIVFRGFFSSGKNFNNFFFPPNPSRETTSLVQVRFLLGPAGSGKTSQCLDEVRTALLASPEGPPLIFLAPKQATFQIERQLLGDSRLQGFTRLFIYSFERLADFILDAAGVPAPRLLNEDGRVMVLRSLLARAGRTDALKLFHASARLPGFAQDLSKVIRECQRAGAGPASLRNAATELAATGPGHNPGLADKLTDVAFLFEGYNETLKAEALEDADRLLNLATEALRPADTSDQPGEVLQSGNILCEALWMDGFAEMTVQELELLAAILPWCGRATLAFCCDGGAVDAAIAGEAPSFSPWSVVAETASRCLIRISPMATVERITLGRVANRGSGPGVPRGQLELFDLGSPANDQVEAEPSTLRFSANRELAHLERHWAAPRPLRGTPESIRLIRCSNAEAEITFAAREIRRHVAAGGRYRDVAVLVREMRPYQDVIHRIFERYEIPHFLDRRESVAHHPLAELTRYALRTIERKWEQEDWFGMLKTGLCCGVEDADWLENAAIERGWTGDKWLTPILIPGDAVLQARLEAVRQKTVQPLLDFRDVVAGAAGAGPTGLELADGLRALWAAFDVEAQLARWTAEAPAKAVHSTVWEQMDEWLRTLALAFAHERVRLQDWMPIIEAGLATLTVGVIPPVLDEVLVGSIDRSRNPELHTVFVLGVNERVFPAVPAAPPLLTESDRLQLEGMLHLGASVRKQLAHERFYAYIAFTRARARLFVTFAEADRSGKKQNASIFVAQLQRLFPELTAQPPDTCPDVVHASELAVPLIRATWNGEAREALAAWNDALDPLLARFEGLPPRFESLRPPLPPAIVDKLYPNRLVTSVSRLEEFGSCAFRFFVTVGLRARERARFEVDARRTGTFQHEVLMAFHHTLQNEGRRWRDLSFSEARVLLQDIANKKLPTFQEGVLMATPRDRVQSGNLVEAMQDFIETAVGWARQYEFDPVAVELEFRDDGPLPAWELTLGSGRLLAFTGTIDRVDALIDRERRHADVVVMDYKSSAREVDSKLLASGVQLQLFAYLAALCRLPETARLLDVDSVSPAGVFYVKLRSTYQGAESRDAAFAGAELARRKAYQHRGRFIREKLDAFDAGAAPGRSGEQFSFRLTKSGEFHSGNSDPIAASEFARLLNEVEGQLIQMGDRVFSGEISLSPYRHKNQTPCERCDYSGLCRIDPWTHEFRSL